MPIHLKIVPEDIATTIVIPAFTISAALPPCSHSASSSKAPVNAASHPFVKAFSHSLIPLLQTYKRASLARAIHFFKIKKSHMRQSKWCARVLWKPTQSRGPSLEGREGRRWATFDASLAPPVSRDHSLTAYEQSVGNTRMIRLKGPSEGARTYNTVVIHSSTIIFIAFLVSYWLQHLRQMRMGEPWRLNQRPSSTVDGEGGRERRYLSVGQERRNCGRYCRQHWHWTRISRQSHRVMCICSKLVAT